jgi:hypothetical protein
MPFATLGTADTEGDRASHLDRPSVFRLNVGVSRETYGRLFGSHPTPPGAAAVVETGHDFTALDVLILHPVYATQSWVCVLNPGAATWEPMRLLFEEAHRRAAERHVRRDGGVSASDG